MDIIGFDYLGPIRPQCEDPNASYILVVVDYFAHFI
jgi:hypothetical protein